MALSFKVQAELKLNNDQTIELHIAILPLIESI